MRLFRLTKSRHAAKAFSGDGARLFGGRWNPKNVALAYTSESRALAVIESLVHLDPEDMADFVFVPAEIEEQFVDTFDMSALPSDWTSRESSAREAGAAWVASLRSLALRVPSAVIPQEHNVLLNPAHPDFSRLVVGGVEPFAFDPRLRAQ